jgi:hypothetical protein
LYENRVILVIPESLPQTNAPDECPTPVVIEDPANDNNTDEDEDGVEPHFEGATFHFTSGNEPDEQTGVYGSAQNFIQAMLDKTMPTLLVKGSNYSNLQELLLENVCPVQFPFGLHLSEQCIGRHWDGQRGELQIQMEIYPLYWIHPEYEWHG